MIRQSIALVPPRKTGRIERLPAALQSFGNLLQRRQDVVRCLQWGFVVIYLSLLLLPVLLPMTPVDAAIVRRVAFSAEVIFWGIWWPAVILSVLLVGQFWCGVLCPDGTLTEFASRHGRRGKIPTWVRWSGWPLLGFSLIYFYEHVVDAYSQPGVILLTVGGASLLALLTGALLGRGKRVWCRYLCPAGSIFSLLSRCAVLHFKVDRAAWDAAPRPQPKPVDCPPLLDVRRLRSSEKCSMCGRCSGHRDAVALSFRSPGSEIERMGDDEVRVFDALAICFVLAGLCYAALHWQSGPAYLWLKGLITPVPAAISAIVLTALAVGALLFAGLLFSSGWRLRPAARLAYGLIPLAGLGLFLGSVDYAWRLLAAAGYDISLLRLVLKCVVLIVAGAWSLHMGWALVARSEAGRGAAVGYLAIVLVLSALFLFAPLAPG